VKSVARKEGGVAHVLSRRVRICSRNPSVNLRDPYLTRELFADFLEVQEKIGSSGRGRTYNPPVNSRTITLGVHIFSMTYMEQRVVFGAPSAYNVSQNVSQISVQP